MLIALAYGAGTGAVLYAILLGGRRLTDRLAPIRGKVNPVMGAVMIGVALMLATNLDIRFETFLARHAPSALINPAHGVEDSSAIADDLASSARFGSPGVAAGGRPAGGDGQLASRSSAVPPTSPTRANGSTRGRSRSPAFAAKSC